MSEDQRNYGTIPKEHDALVSREGHLGCPRRGYQASNASNFGGPLIKLVIGMICCVAILVQVIDVIRKANKQAYLLSMTYEKDDEPNLVGPLFFTQKVDNFDDTETRVWRNTYFMSDTYFRGPGSPLFVVLGGEGPETEILYPYISKRLAKTYGGMTVQTEHRFYGASQPLGDDPSMEDLVQYFNPEQTMMDWVKLLRHLQQERGCNVNNKQSPEYCPIITIGGSYPGFLAVLMRIVHPDVVDIGYGSGAPMILNAQHLAGPRAIDKNAYFKKVTNVAEVVFPGCSAGVYSTLKEVNDQLTKNSDTNHYEMIAQKLGICVESIPSYMRSNSIMGTELTQIVVSVAADMNMDFRGTHPENTLLFQFCNIFTDDQYAATQRFANYLKLLMSGIDYTESNPSSYSCFDMNSLMPSGPNATISCADWTGCGPGISGERWEFQICKDLIMATGFGNHTMFYPPREWTLEWLTQHCQARFGITPQPGRLNDMWHFDDLSDPDRASHILFANGLNDGWSSGSFLTPPNPLIECVNIPNGGHHSELGGTYPRLDDTQEVLEAHDKIEEIIGGWLIDIAS